MKWIEVRRPDGGTFRVKVESVEEFQAQALRGYSVVGPVIFCDESGNGGFVSPLNGPSLMGALLEAHGEELLAWLKSRS